MMFVDEARARGRPRATRVASLAEDGDPVTAQMALLWAALVAENAGDVGAWRPGTPATGLDAPAAHAVPRGIAARPARAARHGPRRPPHVPPSTPRSPGRSCVGCTPTTTPARCASGAPCCRSLEGDLARRASGSSDEITDDGRGGRARLADGRCSPRAPSSRWPAATSRRVCACSTTPWPASRSTGMRLRRAEPLGAARGVRVARGARPVRQHRRRRAAGPRAARPAPDRGDRRVVAVGRPFQDFPLTGVLLAAVGAWALRVRDRGPARRRRTPAGDRRPVGLQPQLPDDGVGAAGGAGRGARRRPPRRDRRRSTPTGRSPISSRRPGRCWTGWRPRSHLPGEAPHRQRREDRDDREAADQRPADLRR